jgi:hypothetical protein
VLDYVSSLLYPLSNSSYQKKKKLIKSTKVMHIVLDMSETIACFNIEKILYLSINFIWRCMWHCSFRFGYMHHI